MSDYEIVDIVDEKNAVLYQVSRQEAHQKGLLHRCVLAQLINLRGEWILVRQAADRQDAGQYVCPVGGHMLAGETVEMALQRETLEEIGFDQFEQKFIGKVIYRRHILGRDENHYFLFYEIYSDLEPIITAEITGFETFTKAQLAEEMKNKPEKFGAAFKFQVKTFYPEMLPS